MAHYTSTSTSTSISTPSYDTYNIIYTLVHTVHTVYSIYTSNIQFKNEDSVSKEYPEFARAYPKLFASVCKPRFNFDKFVDIVARTTDTYARLSRKRKRDINIYIDIETELAEFFKCQDALVKHEYLL